MGRWVSQIMQNGQMNLTIAVPGARSLNVHFHDLIFYGNFANESCFQNAPPAATSEITESKSDKMREKQLNQQINCKIPVKFHEVCMNVSKHKQFTHLRSKGGQSRVRNQ